MPTPLIIFDDTEFTYPEGVAPAVAGVSLEIFAGERVAVVGRNGSGKSTLARLINGLLVPTRGRVTVAGWDTADTNRVWDVRQRVGMVFQNPDNQIVAATVEEDVAFGPENLGVPSAEIEQRVDQALVTVGMQAHRRRGPHLLSGGQKQLVAVAGILAMQPDCIVLDEATAMLDPAGRQTVMDTVAALNRDAGITIVHITHNMAEVVDMDRILVLDRGHLALAGSPEEVFAHGDELLRLGLELPLVADLAAQLRREGVDVPFDVLRPQEMVDYLCR